MNISVAIGTYNGAEFIEAQLKSIVMQLKKDDEIIISDDGSVDETIKIAESFKDSRIKIIKNKEKGIIKNFENAILACKNEVIFLADQDDIWEENKVAKIIETFKQDKELVIVQSSFYITNKELEVMGEGDLKKKGMLGTIIKNNYMGSAMAFKKELVTEVIPFPKNIPMHDMWIGVVGGRKGKVVFIDDKLFYYRRHDNSVTLNGGSILEKIVWRKNLLISLILKLRKK